MQELLIIIHRLVVLLMIYTSEYLGMDKLNQLPELPRKVAQFLRRKLRAILEMNCIMIKMIHLLMMKSIRMGRRELFRRECSQRKSFLTIFLHLMETLKNLLILSYINSVSTLCKIQRKKIMLLRKLQLLLRKEGNHSQKIIKLSMLIHFLLLSFPHQLR